MRRGIPYFGGKTLDLDSNKLHELMKEAGFRDVVCNPFVLPLGSWAKYPIKKAAGKRQLHSMLDGIGGFSQAVFTRALGWELPDFEVFLKRVRRSLVNGHQLYISG
jgi:hypothetical protein